MALTLGLLALPNVLHVGFFCLESLFFDTPMVQKMFRVKSEAKESATILIPTTRAIPASE